MNVYFLPECKAGFYGVDCRQLCLCQNGGSCDKISGRCLCASGWTGIECELGEKICYSSYQFLIYYDNYYLYVIVCVINIIGICLSVFLTECAPGFFGADCQNACECENDGTCDRQDGKCTCPAGWVGLKCEKGKK